MQAIGKLVEPSLLPKLESAGSVRYFGQPFLLAETGTPERTVNQYFGSRHFRGYSPATRVRYAYSIRLWLDFCLIMDTRWEDATPDTVSNFKYWRMTDSRNVSRVAGNSFHCDLAAISGLYQWANRRFDVEDPIVRREHTGRTLYHRENRRIDRGSPLAEPAGVRDRNVKWLEPAAVRRWIDIGLRGFDTQGFETPHSRMNRTGTRDAAFADFLYGSGLRVSEAASMLISELPETHGHSRQYRSGRLASSCAKGGSARQWWCPRVSLGDVWSYIEGQRAEWVRNAQRNGRYRNLNNLFIVEPTPSGALRFKRGAPIGSNGQPVSLDVLDPVTRLQLYIETTSGIEPLGIWLNENGLPRKSHAWQGTFRTGNERLERAGHPQFRCTAHMLRHSFALRWYSIGRLLWDRRLSMLTDEEQRDFRTQFGDTWHFVQTLLGHRHPQTTVDIYLEPFKGLDVQLLLEYAAHVPLSELMQIVFQKDGRVLTDIGAAQ